MSADAFTVWAEQAQRDWLDTDGRPLAEVSSPAYPSDTVVVACPYSGGRKGRPMNATALEQVRAHAEVGLATLSAAVGPEPRVADVYAAACRVVAAPLFLPRPVPAASSALYKTTAGFLQLLTALLLASPGLAETAARDLPGAASLLTVLERGRWLIGQQQVCAGSPGEISLAWEVLCGRRHVDGAALPLAPADWAPGATALVLGLTLAAHARLVRAERDGLLGFGTADPRVDEWPLGARLWYRRPAPWLVAATADPTATLEHVRRLFVEPPPAVRLFLEGERDGHAADERTFWRAAVALPRLTAKA